jgi:medium-chain acyl-[acyl-carrier-protein] hydrolase
METWPHWGDDLELKTWIRPLSGLLAIRDFEIFHDGKMIGECTTQWLILNLETRKPAEKNLILSQNETRSDAPTHFNASKIFVKDNLKPLAEFNVRNSDLDLNGHVNNTRYAQWILDSLAVENHQQYILREYEVNFIAETKSGDVITILSGELSPDRFLFQGFRAKDNKTVFAATFTVGAGQLSPSNIHS